MSFGYRAKHILEGTVSAERKARSVYDVFFMLAQKNQRGPNWSTQFDHGTEGSTPGPPCVFVPHKWTYWKDYCLIYGWQVIPRMAGRPIICALVRRLHRIGLCPKKKNHPLCGWIFILSDCNSCDKHLLIFWDEDFCKPVESEWVDFACDDISAHIVA